MGDGQDNLDASIIRLKRKRNEEEKKDNKAKRLKAQGKEYVNKKGVLKLKRKTGDKCRCNRNCLTILSDNDKKLILSNFNELGSNTKQNIYLSNLIKPLNVAPRRQNANPRKRSHVYHYEIHLETQVKSLCREGFASIHGIGVKRVRRIAALKAEAKILTDMRRRHIHRGNKKDEDLIKRIDDHIQSFPFYIVHYGPVGQRKRYLSS